MVELPEHSHHIKALPKDVRGFPVPWFVQWFDGKKPCEAGTGVPDFRVIDPVKFERALKGPRCWICGGMMGRYRVLVVGPVSTLNHVTSEPPSHRSCALFAIRACPFLLRPRMRRNNNDLPIEAVSATGVHLEHNPGVMCMWTASPTGYYPFREGRGFLFRLRGPFRTEWFTEGKPASRSVVMEALQAARETMKAIANGDGEDEIEDMYQRALMLLPPEEAHGTDADHLPRLPARAGEELDT